MQLSEFEGRAIEHVLRSHAPGKHAARSALRHLERAWSLKDSMPEVAVFLGITAEEESAAALFLSLKRRKYEGAGALSCRSHVQKTALHPFLLAAGKLLSQIPEAGTARFIFDDNLSPITSIDSGDGPMKIKPASCTFREKSAFSDKKP